MVHIHKKTLSIPNMPQYWPVKSNKSCTKCLNLIVFRLVLQLSLPKSLTPGAKLKMQMYTSGQPYGITTTKWHLRKFGRYLLFLVVCSIAERNTVDFIDPLHNQIECQTQSVLSGDRWDSREGKSECRGVTWSEACLAITTLMLLCIVGFR